MRNQPTNIFLHFLNKDTQEIFGIRQNDSPVICAYLKKGLNASVLLCDSQTYCVLPLGFWFESQYTRKLLTECGEFLKEGFVRFSVRETSIEEFIEKKREQYFPFRKSADYESFFQDFAVKQLQLLNPFLISRKTKVGQYCSTLWIKAHHQLISENSGDLIGVYSNLGNFADRRTAAENIMLAARDSESPFIWGKVSEMFSQLSLRNRDTKNALRLYFEGNYYTAYLKEYNATHLNHFYCIDRQIDFNVGSLLNRVTDYQKLEAFLRVLGIENLLDASPQVIVRVKRSTSWFCLLQKYVDLCNSEQGIIFDYLCVKALEEEEIKQSVFFIQEALRNPDRQIFFETQGFRSRNVHFNDTEEGDSGIEKDIDVLMMVATVEEERAVIANSEWKEKRTKKGYAYFIRKEGLKFALARSIDMRVSSSSVGAQYFFDKLNPRYLAMLGFCAGKRGDVQLGDVVVPYQVYKYGVGKRTDENTLLENLVYTIPPIWRQKVERFGNEWRNSITVEKPVSYEKQTFLFIEMMIKKDFKIPYSALSAIKELSTVRSIIKEHLHKGWIIHNEGCIEATKSGRTEYLKMFHFDYAGDFQEPDPQIRTGGLATGDYVQQTSEIFRILEQSERRTCALDMEGYALANAANFNQVPFLIAKGVGDYADGQKSRDNQFIEYAVFSAYRFLVAFFNDLEGPERLSDTVEQK